MISRLFLPIVDTLKITILAIINIGRNIFDRKGQCQLYTPSKS